MKQRFRQEFVACHDGQPRFRRPILAIVGGTRLGKSMLAAHTLKRVANKLGLKDFLEVTVEDSENMDLADFDRRVHAGVLLDGVGDAMFLKRKPGSPARSPKDRKRGEICHERFFLFLFFLWTGSCCNFRFVGPELGRAPHRPLAVQSSECPTATPRRASLH